MGRILASILSSSIDARTSDAQDREAVLVEAATAAELERQAVEELLEEDRTALPGEQSLRRLLEALDADPDAVIAQARQDGDVFEGDERESAQITDAVGARIIEAAGDGEAPGTKRYKVVVIRPGRAKGPGRRFYPTRMLESNAANFGGQPIFFNHEDLSTILKRGHGSRDPRDLCGWLQEGTWFDPAYAEPDDAANGRRPGAVMGHADFAPEAADHIDRFPQALKLSINMDSTKIAVGRAETGELAPLVEGVVKGSGSTDLITGEAGAGGRVLERLRESGALRYAPAHEDLAAIGDDQLIEAVRARDGLAERLRDDDADLGGSVDPKKLIESVAGDPDAAEQLAEVVLGTETGKRLVEAEVSAREDSIREEATAESRRELDLRDMRDDAHRLIESKAAGQRGGILTPAFVEDLKARYTLRDGRYPTPALDVYDRVAEDGTTVEKSAREVLLEAVESDIAREEGKLREAAPTRVRDLGAGPGAGDGGSGSGDGGDGGSGEPAPDPLAERLGLDTATVRKHQGVL